MADYVIHCRSQKEVPHVVEPCHTEHDQHGLFFFGNANDCQIGALYRVSECDPRIRMRKYRAHPSVKLASRWRVAQSRVESMDEYDLCVPLLRQAQRPVNCPIRFCPEVRTDYYLFTHGYTF